MDKPAPRRSARIQVTGRKPAFRVLFVSVTTPLKLEAAGRVLLAVVIFIPQAVNALPDVQAEARAVDEHYNRLQSLRADFVEIYQGSGVTRTESGTLWLKKPGKMRWEYRSPEEKLFVGDGRSAWFYLPAEKQVRKSSLKQLQDVRSPLAFLLGKTKLEKELQGLSFAPEVAVWKPGDAVLKGVPRGMEDRVRQVLIEITPEHKIARMLIAGADESVTEFRFSNQSENGSAPAGNFEFVPPAGTEVIEDETDQ